mmetsp:Transcript_731/g.1480  ORF Transcript_731/g.1480 Transcript_731/m.1480 type:complete len:123 (+) Transcript_731:317-685(+)
MLRCRKKVRNCYSLRSWSGVSLILMVSNLFVKCQVLCEESNNENMPWDIQMCDGDLKLVHRTQPVLGHSEYNFDPRHNPAMSGKETRTKSRFGLPSEKVRNFVSLLKPHPMHWRKIPAELYI